MSERFTAKRNVNESKNTRLPIADEFKNYRFSRDAQAHVYRYMWIVEELIAHARKYRPASVLDIGGGDAYLARVLNASYVVTKKQVLKQYTLFDIDDKSLARTQASLTLGGVPTEFICGDITTGDLKDVMPHDVVVCLEVLEHIQPEFVPKVLQDIAKLAPRAYISTPNFTGGSGKLPDDHIKEWDVDELTAVIEKHFTVHERIGTWGHLAKMRKLARQNLPKEIFKLMETTFPADLRSLAYARILFGLTADPTAAQNILYVLESKCHG